MQICNRFLLFCIEKMFFFLYVSEKYIIFAENLRYICKKIAGLMLE